MRTYLSDRVWIALKKSFVADAVTGRLNKYIHRQASVRDTYIAEYTAFGNKYSLHYVVDAQHLRYVMVAIFPEHPTPALIMAFCRTSHDLDATDLDDNFGGQAIFDIDEYDDKK